jgi:hypothetical protein
MMGASSKPQPGVAAFLGIAVLFVLRCGLEVSHQYLAGVSVFLPSRRRPNKTGDPRNLTAFRQPPSLSAPLIRNSAFWFLASDF